MTVERMMRQLLHFLNDQSGATAIEYGLIAGMISAAIIGAVQTVGVNLNARFTAIANALN